MKRPQPKSYPHIHGLYLLLRASGLTFVDQSSGKPQLRLDQAVVPAWQALNPVERYSALLEAWLLRGQPEIIGEAHRWSFGIPDHFQDVANLLDWIPDSGLPVGDDSDVQDRLRFTPGAHNLGLLDLFGLITIQPGTPIPGQGWQIARIERTPLGRSLWTCLQAHFFGDFDRILALESQGEPLAGVLQPILQPYWPAWQTSLILSEWRFRDGVHRFRVALGRSWRRLAIPAALPLDMLASTILQAFDFGDHDHLYRFSYQNRFGILERVNHPYMDEGPWTSEVRIGDLPLGLGQMMTYLFDFGDSWEFTVTLEQDDLHGRPPRLPMSHKSRRVYSSSHSSRSS